MTSSPVHLVVNLSITNADEYRKYEKGIFGFLKSYGGEIVTFDDNPVTLEGDAPREGRMIIIRFPTEQAARDWYADPGYQELSEYRRAGTKLEFLTLVHALPPRA